VNTSRRDAIALCGACYAQGNTVVEAEAHHRATDVSPTETCASCGAPATQWVIAPHASRAAAIDIDLTGAIIRVSIDGVVDGDGLAALAAEVAGIGPWKRPIMIDLRGIQLTPPCPDAIDRFVRTVSRDRARVALLVDEDLMPDAAPAGVVVGRDIADIVERLTEGDL
jgi:hypothetical protein